MAANHVAAARDGRVARASKIAADRIAIDFGAGIVVDLYIAVYLATKCDASGRIAAVEVVGNFGAEVAAQHTVLNAEITANDDGRFNQLHILASVGLAGPCNKVAAGRSCAEIELV